MRFHFAVGPPFGVVDLAVVELEVLPSGAAFDGAFASGDDHRGAELGGDVSSEVGDGGDVLASLDDRGDERGAEQGSHPFRADRSDAGDLTGLAFERVTAHEHTLR